MDICPKCGNATTETAGLFNKNLRFTASKKQRWYIRTVCMKCRKFLGYRPTDPRKLKGKPSHAEDS